jgi:hypothetical protein
MPLTKSAPDASAALTIRLAGPADADALRVLSVLDSTPFPVGPALVAEVGGELWAAVSLVEPVGVADPFRPSGELLALLAARARQLESGGAPRRRRLRFPLRVRRPRPAT